MQIEHKLELQNESVDKRGKMHYTMLGDATPGSEE